MKRVRASILGVALAALFVSPAVTRAQPGPATTAAPAKPQTPADRAWAAFQALPTRWPSGTPESEYDAWTQKHVYGAYATAALAFLRDFPEDPRRWDAAYSYAATMINFASVAKPEEITRARALVADVLSAPDAPEALKERAAFKLVIHDLGNETESGNVTMDLAKVESTVDAFMKRFPRARNLSFVELKFIDILLARDPAAAEKRLRSDLSHPDPAVVAMATGRLAVVEAKIRPLDLKFTAVDGRDVDLAALRGKVVLVDFWATWCVPCVAELPNVKKVYEAWHGRGFEVVGVSLDGAKDQEKLLGFVKDRGLPWPQYFDGLGWDNLLAKKYAVRSIPAMFLLDQKGLLVSTDARGPALEALVKKLLTP